MAITRHALLTYEYYLLHTRINSFFLKNKHYIAIDIMTPLF